MTEIVVRRNNESAFTGNFIISIIVLNRFQIVNCAEIVDPVQNFLFFIVGRNA